jgi:hypothetical protein
MEYVRTAIPELIARFGPEEARHLAGAAAYLIGMQFHGECRRLLGSEGAGAEGFAAFFAGMARAQGDEVTIERQGEPIVLRHEGWRLMRGAGPLHPVAFEVWNRLWEGCLAAHDRFLRWQVLGQDGGATPRFAWRIERRPENRLAAAG